MKKEECHVYDDDQSKPTIAPMHHHHLYYCWLLQRAITNTTPTHSYHYHLTLTFPSRDVANLSNEAANSWQWAHPGE